MMEESKYFVVGNKRFIFDDKDHIFYSDEKAPELTNSDSCLCCDHKFKSTKSVHYW